MIKRLSIIVVILAIVVWYFNSHFWDNFYTTVIVPKAVKENTLAPIVTSITGLVALLSLGLAFYTFNQNKWKPKLTLSFYVIYRGGLRELKLGKHPRSYRKGFLDSGHNLSFSPHQSLTEIPMVSETNFQNEDEDIDSYPMYIDVVAVSVRNIGRSMLRFKSPSLIARNRKIDRDIHPLEIRKNGQLLTSSENMYTALDAGEVAEFFYSFDKILDYLNHQKEDNNNERREKNRFYRRAITLVTSNKWLRILLLPWISFSFFLLGYMPRSRKQTRIQFSLVDNTGKRNVMSSRHYWVLDKYQSRILNSRSYQMMLNNAKKTEQEHISKFENITDEEAKNMSWDVKRYHWEQAQFQHHLFDIHKRKMQVNFVMQLVYQSLFSYFHKNWQEQSTQDLYKWSVIVSNYLVEQEIVYLSPKTGVLQVDRQNIERYSVSYLTKLIQSNDNAKNFIHVRDFFNRFRETVDMLPYE